jgi:23S rRNA (pseudouridine1915-N3)-methyltransferase
MRITIIAVGKLKSKAVQSLVEEYEKRLPPALKINRIEVASPAGGPPSQIMAAEADRIRDRVPQGSVVAALSEKGKEMDSKAFAEWLAAIRDSGKDLCFIIGGADGIHQSLIKETHHHIALSRLTFPHELVRAILAEQIYRAFSILAGSPYHRQ